MKTLAKTISTVSLILIFTLICSTAYAGVNENSNKIFDPKKMSSGLIFDLDHIFNNPMKFRLDLHQPEKHLVQISIYDKDNNKVYSAFTSKTQNSQLFNLSELGYGEYTVEITTLGEVARDKIILEKPAYLNPVAFIKESETTKNKVTIVSLNAGSPVNFTITDEGNNVVYNDIYYKKDLRENINLNELPQGDYTLTLESNDVFESKNITIK
ncbi:DUF3244 domain-containing protein [Mangrovivirga cuniculi]|uniref:Secretion system C-terminal sorting domain-containing protein n=1 Tax=Mangrovivirga cuniculi TaxID=2715131 RepID=A0A4D7JKZ5_9BACT|nr:hypothetical protein [Mangrovivirga cuniculi]QCK16271.1 hypothetical protein DCC35_16755 [Mangrovivirga cuniculi]